MNILCENRLIPFSVKKTFFLDKTVKYIQKWFKTFCIVCQIFYSSPYIEGTTKLFFIQSSNAVTGGSLYEEELCFEVIDIMQV